ncbi:hypothetical protein UlMin_043624 [Ulmus minor]
MRPNMKRKELEDVDQVSYDFSDFSLSSPARKIRRLDAELPPIMEEEEPEIPSPPAVDAGIFRARGGPIIEELDSVPDNEDSKAIVLFKPPNSSFFQHSPSNVSFSVDSHLISGFKDQFKANYCQKRPAEEEDKEKAVRDNYSNKQCLAVVPWSPSPSSSPFQLPISTPTMEATPAPAEGDDNMEIEEANGDVPQEQQADSLGYGGMWGAAEGFPQWQQQHCLVPQPPQNISTPITWFR